MKSSVPPTHFFLQSKKQISHLQTAPHTPALKNYRTAINLLIKFLRQFYNSIMTKATLRLPLHVFHISIGSLDHYAMIVDDVDALI